MLYLPAGWFHEVTSSSAADEGNTGEVAEEDKVGHLAFNYWFHPPDRLEADKPYSSDFWQKDYDRRGSL